METETIAKKFKIEKNGIDVFNTDNYDLFKTTKGNRPISQGLVKKIYKSICDHGWIESSIIIIGEGMRVLDGQHRIEALRRFKKEFDVAYKVKYIVDRKLDNIEKIQAFNVNKATWGAMDYLHSYIAQGNDHYAQYRAFLERHKITHTCGMTLLTNEKYAHASFKAGKFTCHDWGVPNTRADRLNEIFKYFRKAKTGPFVRAIVQCWKHPDFDHKKFIHKLARDRDMLYSTGSTEQYVRLIENVYNFKSRSKIRFDF